MRPFALSERKRAAEKAAGLALKDPQAAMTTLAELVWMMANDIEDLYARLDRENEATEPEHNVVENRPAL